MQIDDSMCVSKDPIMLRRHTEQTRQKQTHNKQQIDQRSTSITPINSWRVYVHVRMNRLTRQKLTKTSIVGYHVFLKSCLIQSILFTSGKWMWSCCCQSNQINTEYACFFNVLHSASAEKHKSYNIDWLKPTNLSYFGFDQTAEVRFLTLQLTVKVYFALF